MLLGRYLVCAYDVLSADTSDCAYTYQQQPPKTLECNPYPNRRLILNCEIKGPNQWSFSILWYRKSRNNQQPQRLSGPRDSSSKYSLQSDPPTTTTNFRAHRSQLRVQRLNDSDAGWYFCQGNLSNATLLTPSNMLLLDLQSEYIDASNCSDSSEAYTTRESSCATIATDNPATVGTTPPNVATGDSRGGTDPPSSSPTGDSYHPSLPTTLAPTPTATPTATPTPESGMLQVALYAVISVIVVFCAVIVTLAVTIVILYRRKRGHANFKKTAG